MFAELPKLFGKAFAIGFFLPAALLVLGLGLVFQSFDVATYSVEAASNDLLGLTASIFTIWLVAIFMIALNRPLVRMLEGYGGRKNPFHLGRARMERRFVEDVKPLLDEQRRIDEIRTKGMKEPVSRDFTNRLQKAVAQFPDEGFVLPTWLGNIMRAYEVYPRIVYGLDPIPAWPRLMMVLPEQARTQIQEGRAVLDFAVNLLAVAVVTVLVYSIFAIAELSLPNVWLIFIAIGLLLIARFMMYQAAVQWGEQVKSAFDLYRGVLAEQLGLDLPLTNKQEREMWNAVSRTMIFRAAAAVEDLDRFRRVKPLPASDQQDQENEARSIEGAQTN